MSSPLQAERAPPTARFDAAAPELPARLQRFLQRHWQQPVEVVELRRYPAGMSWVTIGFTARVGGVGSAGGAAAERRLILRVGDPAGLLAPYRAEPEYQVLAALQGLPGLPIPGVVACSDDAAVLGAPFIVMTHVAGDTPQPWPDAVRQRGEAVNRSLGEDFCDALAALHAFDWRATPLTGWPDAQPAADPTRRQIRWWSDHAGVAGPHTPSAWPPQMHDAMRWLQAHVPAVQRRTIVHGDYRVGNFLQHGGRISAVLDWEFVHLGDPHEDLAWAAARTFAGGTSRIGGLLERSEFFARYQARSGIVVDASALRYHAVLVQYKLAALVLGASRRIAGGRARDVRMAAMGLQLAPTLLELNRVLDESA